MGLYKVFTTNYDLIPYWALMHQDTDRFRDYFWSGGCFDISDTALYENKTAVHYLHGAIHLVERDDGITEKLTANNLSSLTELFDLAHPSKYPLFITEGTSEDKIIRIRRNDYLRFCYETLEESSGGIVVIGHSIHKDYDQHIIDAINASSNKRVAISVYPKLSCHDIVSLKARLIEAFDGKTLHFFDSSTHPLGANSLTVTP